jgi:hypothetical protein
MIVQPELMASLVAAERQAEARAQNRAARLASVRRLERRAAVASRQARLVRLAIQ